MKGGTTTSRPQNCRLIIPAMVKIPALALEGEVISSVVVIVWREAPNFS